MEEHWSEKPGIISSKLIDGTINGSALTETAQMEEYKMKCKVHPKYKAIKAPRCTNKYPKGCPICIEIYKAKDKQWKY